VIPAAGAAAGALAAVAGSTQPLALASAALAGAGVAAAVRSLCGDGPAALAAATLAPLLAVASLVDHLGIPALAFAAAAWTLAELARPGATPVVALLPAAAATALAPAFVVLLPIAATRLRGRARMPAQIAGGVACLALVIYVGPPHGTPAALASGLVAALGPLLAVAALAGCALVARTRVDLVACVAAALLADLHAGTIGPATVGLAALCAGLAIARFAGTIRLAAGQTIIAATCGALLLVAPAWLAVVR